MAAKFKYSRHTTPFNCEAFYVWLEKPQDGFKEGDKPKYKITVATDDTHEARTWCQKVTDTALEEAKASGVKMKKAFDVPFKYPEDFDDEEFGDKPDGTRGINEKLKGKIWFKTSSQFPSTLIDAMREALPEGIFPRGGDTVKVRVEAVPYLNGANCGITLRPVTVMLIEKRAGFAGEADTEGFEDEEGGYVPPKTNDEGNEEF